MTPDVLQDALDAAVSAGESARGTTSPNPPVGCALVDDHGTVLAAGATSPAGGPHAEINALQRAGDRAKGATAVVTLEPCNHTGRTGPCSHALARAGITRVIYLTADPFKPAAGGADYLREHGVDVDYRPTRVAALQPWLRSVVNERPSVTLKFASTLDGFTAAVDGTSQWVTGADARAGRSTSVKTSASAIGAAMSWSGASTGSSSGEGSRCARTSTPGTITPGSASPRHCIG